MAVSRKVMHAVSEALHNAAENGFTFDGLTAEEIADDMVSNDADIAEMPREEVLEAIRILR